jgi:predicted nucleic acid-binding protein
VSQALREAGATGNPVNHACIVALMRQHGVGTIWTNDRDFRTFDGIRAKDPLRG